MRRPDIWDGFGLWLALTEPGVCRLARPRCRPGPPVGRRGGRRARTGGLGLAVDGAPRRCSAAGDTVRGFADAGRAAARRLAGLSGSSVDAGDRTPRTCGIEAKPTAPPWPHRGPAPAGGSAVTGVDSRVDLPHARRGAIRAPVPGSSSTSGISRLVRLLVAGVVR